MPDLILPANDTRSRFTVKSLRDRIRSEMGLFDNVYISDDNVDDWLLEFQNRLARDEEWYQFVGTFNTSGGTRYYDVPPDLITMKLLQFDVWVLSHISLHDLIARYPLALTSAYLSSRPWTYTLQANSIMLFPVPTAASGVMMIYSALPPEPVSDDDFYFWPPYFDTAAIHYGCLRASLKDFSREGQRRLASFTQAYEKEYERAAERLKGRGEEDIAVYGRRQLGHSNFYSTYPRKVPMPDGGFS